MIGAQGGSQHRCCGQESTAHQNTVLRVFLRNNSSMWGQKVHRSMAGTNPHSVPSAPRKNRRGRELEAQTAILDPTTESAIITLLVITNEQLLTVLGARESLAFGHMNALIPCVWCPRDVELVVDLVMPVLVYHAIASKSSQSHLGFAVATYTVFGAGVHKRRGLTGKDRPGNVGFRVAEHGSNPGDCVGQDGCVGVGVRRLRVTSRPACGRGLRCCVPCWRRRSRRWSHGAG